MKKIIVIYGPTGSGKTNLSNLIAQGNNFNIVNIDAMQVYDKIKILNASPEDSDKKLINHSLFNFFSVYNNYSLDLYIKDCENILKSTNNANYVFVGGTGMYINGLINGLRVLDKIPQSIRNFTTEKLAKLGNEKFYEELKKLDPKTIGKIHPNNTYRLIRAYEVKETSGKSIYSLDVINNESIVSSYEIIKIYLKPEREFLYEICDKRFIDMLQNGAIDEVESLISDYDSLSISVKKIIGMNELYEYLNNRCTIEEVISIAQQRTRNYAKRQYTWFSKQLESDFLLEFSSLKEYKDQINKILKTI